MNLRKNPFFLTICYSPTKYLFLLGFYLKVYSSIIKKIRDIESQKPTPGHQNERKERTEIFTVMRILNIINQGVSTLLCERRNIRKTSWSSLLWFDQVYKKFLPTVFFFRHHGKISPLWYIKKKRDTLFLPSGDPGRRFFLKKSYITENPLRYLDLKKNVDPSFFYESINSGRYVFFSLGVGCFYFYT